MIPHVPLGRGVSDLVDWLLATVPWLFDAVSAVMQVLVDGLTDALVTPPPVAWIVVATLLALLVRGPWLALYTLLAGLLIVSLELWAETMQTLALVLVAAVIATAIGVPLGVLAARHRAVSVAVRPVLDFMQTTPVFVYLIPAVFFFGVGVVPGVVATILFAIPPGVRLTELGIRQVDREVVEAAQAFGSRPGQVLREVQLPLALPSIMAGVNQVIMLALSMVVTAGLLGAAGLGAVVVRAVTQLDVASGVEGGLAVVLLAIFLDRLTATLGHETAVSRLLRARTRRSASRAEPAPSAAVG
ncbi:ABC transporter permease subunit [Modestobacter muralis]|uniref:ABC transporter permease subunit n=1 Tax=Modestobacter muralis TaxID=1608614 RepID=A0A6P0ESW9_9ACTN|nr:ABC transporter permease subunit [Modestobacter muralis]NEN50975.1 ABC transporter permease subunit [Modestobacter muralis]